MQARTVYRIEDGRGLGPFQSEEARNAIRADRYNEDRINYPTPANDPGFDQEQLWEFVDRYGDDELMPLPSVGCCSVEQLRHWFDAGSCKALAALGYFLSIFKVEPDNIVEGAFQVAFDRNHSSLVEQLPACALWEDAELALAA
jgi:hypothetical protein